MRFTRPNMMRFVDLQDQVRWLLLQTLLMSPHRIGDIATITGYSAGHCRRVIRGDCDITISFMAVWFAALGMEMKLSCHPKGEEPPPEEPLTLEQWLGVPE